MSIFRDIVLFLKLHWYALAGNNKYEQTVDEFIGVGYRNGIPLEPWSKK